jgi:hypothetical protein
LGTIVSILVANEKVEKIPIGWYQVESGMQKLVCHKFVTIIFASQYEF